MLGSGPRSAQAAAVSATRTSPFAAMATPLASRRFVGALPRRKPWAHRVPRSGGGGGVLTWAGCVQVSARERSAGLRAGGTWCATCKRERLVV